jgi:predicted TIM-barrel fold metal-dependent hydrolase
MKVKGGMLDGDGHLIERDEELFQYLEAPYKGNNTLLTFPFFPPLDGYHRGAIMARLGIHKDHTINAKTWIDFLDGTELESTVLYPTAGLAFPSIQDPTWAVPLARAYNDWFTDKFHKASPDRLKAVALVPTQDVPEAVKELRRAVTELGMVGGVLGANSAEIGVRKPLGHPDFWPLYEEAERLDVPIAIHGAPSMSLGINSFNRFAQTHALEHPIAQMIQLTSMVMEGVFERFQKLRVAFLEAGVGWVPFMMDRLDRSYEVWSGKKYREFSEWLKKKPSEYIACGRIYFNCEGDEQTLPYALKRLGHKTVMFASDFPHETNIERAKHEMHDLLTHEELTDEAKQAIFHDNIVRFNGSRVLKQATKH